MVAIRRVQRRECKPLHFLPVDVPGGGHAGAGREQLADPGVESAVGRAGRLQLGCRRRVVLAQRDRRKEQGIKGIVQPGMKQ